MIPSPRLRLAGAALVASAVACNAILGIDSAPLVDAGKGVHPYDAGIDAMDATVQSHPDATSDAAANDAHEAGHDAVPDAPSCGDGGSRDALAEGAQASDPESTVCNTSLTKDDGGTCNTSTGFCCNFNGDGGRPSPDAETRCLPNSALVQCARHESPTQCDETADCNAGSICCLGIPQGDNSNNLAFVELCTPRNTGADGGSCARLPEVVRNIKDAGVQVLAQVCKDSSECEPCGTCSVWCCNGSTLEIATCTNPFSAILCERGPCPQSAGDNVFLGDNIQDYGETDIDCGGKYLPNGTLDPASDQAQPCGDGYKCKSGYDCISGSCETGICGAAGDH